MSESRKGGYWGAEISFPLGNRRMTLRGWKAALVVVVLAALMKLAVVAI